MIWTIVFVIALIAVVLGLLIKEKAVYAGAGLAMILCTALGSFVTVPTGYQGVLLQFGAVKGDLSQGLHFITPFVQSVYNVEVRTQKESVDAAAASKDLQDVATTVAVNFQIEPTSVGHLYSQLGPNYVDRIMQPAIQEMTKATVAKYTAEELIQKREQVKAELDTGLADRLKAYNIHIDAVSLTNFTFSEDFTKAIEMKQVAQQSAEQQKYELQTAQLKAQQIVATAEGQAKATTVTALALTASGGEKTLMKQWIEKWDGHLPQITSSGGGMMFNVSDLVGKK